MAVSVLPENFFVDLLPTKIMELDTTGVLHATLSGFQDRSDDIRAYVSFINKLIDPFAGYPIAGTCVATNYTDEFGLNVTRTVLTFDLQSDPSYQAFEAGNLTQDEAKAWMGEVLSIDPTVISSVTTTIDPFKTVYEPMIGYLAKNLGVVFPTSNADDPRNAELVASQFSRLPIKGTAKSIEIAGLIAGFDSVHVNPLWGRLSPRNPVDIGLSVNNQDFSAITLVEPTIVPSEFYDPLDYRDGPFYTWSTRLSLLNSTNFVSQANGSNPYLRWKIGGLLATNFRGVYNTASTYNKGDIVVSTTGRSFLAQTTTTSIPPTSFVTANFLMPEIDSSVSVSVSNSSWMTVGQSVSVYDAGTLVVGSISGTTVNLINKGANNNLAPGITVNAGSVIVSQDSSIWLEIEAPSASIYTLSGGLPNVESSADLSSTIKVEGLAEGESFNGLQVVVENVNNVISTIETLSTDPSTVVVTTLQPHGLTTGSYVFISNVSPFDYVGLYTITVTASNKFTYSLPSNIYVAGVAADGIVPYYSNGDFEVTIFDRLSSIKYRTSYYNLVLTVNESTIQARSVPVKPNPDVIKGVNEGSLTAVPPYFPFSGTTEVEGNTPQVNTAWLSTLAAETDSILNSVKPATRYVRSFSTGVLYEDQVGYAEYANQTLIFSATSPLSGTITGPIYPRTARVTIVRTPSVTQFFRVVSFGVDSPTITISPELLLTFNAIVGTQYRIDSKDSLFDPWYPASPVFIATSSVVYYQLGVYEAAELVGQSDENDPDQVSFSTTATFGVVTVDLNYYSGVFSGTRPAQFPPSDSVIANWVLTDTGTIRTEPTIVQKQAGTLGFLPRAEDQFGYSSGTAEFGSRPTQYPDVNEWTRPLEREVLDRDLEIVYGNEEKFPGKFIASADSNDGVTYGLFLVPGIFPYRFRFSELVGKNPLQSLAYSGNSLYYVGIRYGQVMACPERTFSQSMQSGLSAWIPFNAHPDDNLQINSVYPTLGVLTTTGLVPEDRVWNNIRGWITHCHGLTSSLSVDPLLDELSFSFWIDPQNSATLTTILTLGPIQIKMASTSSLQVFYGGSLEATLSISGFSYISVCQKSGALVVGVNGSTASYAVTPTTTPFYELTFSSDSSNSYYIQDFKLWSVFKTSSEIASYYQPTIVPTTIASLPTPIEVSTTGDRWFLKVLSSGFVTTGLQPESKLVEVSDQYNSTTGGTTVETSQGTITQYPGNLLPVANYDIQGRFIADSGRNLVGIPGGTVPTTRKLGEAFLPTSAINRAPASPTTGLPSGINPEWLNDTSTGYIRVVSAPFSSTGGVVSTQSTGTVSPWPNPAYNTNPLVDRIWIQGDSGTIYQLGVGGYELSPTFNVAAIDPNEMGECPSGAVTILTNGSNKLSVNSSNVVYATGTVDTTTPRTYLYRHSYLVYTFSASEGWIPTESSSLYEGNPSLYSTGQLMWSSTAGASTLTPGHYRIKITAYNHGRVASTFKGFDVEVTIGQNVTFPLVLSPNSTEEETYYDFYVSETIVAPWLVQIYWGGIVDDPTRGITYQLVVTGIELDRLKTQVYRVGPGTSLVEISTTASGTTPVQDLTPGGWMAEISNTGTIGEWAHEANVRPNVGGIEQPYTLSELLTMSTDEKVSRVMLSNDYAGQTVVPDPASPTPPSVVSQSQTLSPSTSPIQVGYGLGIDVVATNTVNYLWYFWDNSVEVTSEGTIQKTVNQGGNLVWTCVVADEWGQSDSTTGTISVNAPPVIRSASLSNNDLPPIYSTTLTTLVSDPDSSSPITVWLDGETPVTVSTLDSGTTQGTATFTFNVSTSSTKVLHAVDSNGGTTLLDIDIRALAYKPIVAAVIAEPRTQRIGTVPIRFTCRVTDPNGGGTPTFAWDFLTSNGWAEADFSGVTGFSSITGGYTSAGLSQSLGGGSYQNNVLVPSIPNQTAGFKLVRLTITPTIGTAQVFYGSVNLIENHTPTIDRFDIVSEGPLEAGEPVTILAVATDVDNDILSYAWVMSNVQDLNPQYKTNPITVTPNTQVLSGSLTVSDPYGLSATASIPPVLIASRTVVDGTVGVPLTYVARAMSATTGTFTWGIIPSGLTQIDGTILGTPLVEGITNTTLSVASTSGIDTRAFTWRIATAVIPPLSPTNLIVNGDGTNPRYTTGQNLTIQWTVTTDGGALPSSIIELCKFDGTVIKTIEIPTGANVYTVTSNDILTSFGSYQDILVKVYLTRNTAKSQFPAQTIVTFA